MSEPKTFADHLEAVDTYADAEGIVHVSLKPYEELRLWAHDRLATPGSGPMLDVLDAVATLRVDRKRIVQLEAALRTMIGPDWEKFLAEALLSPVEPSPSALKPPSAPSA